MSFTPEGLRVGLDTLGCRMNQSESAAMMEGLERNGFCVVPFESAADVYVVNTCTVTGKSDYRSRQLARRAVRSNRNAVVVLAGCYPQASPGEAAALRGVDLILGNREKLHLAERLTAFLQCNGLHKRPSGRPVVEVSDMDRGVKFDEVPIRNFPGNTRAFIKVQDGCDFRCSFCAITLARGPSRSLPPHSALRQVRGLVSAGFREVVLTGVDLGSYGWDLNPATDLAFLVRQLGEVRGLDRLRISSLNPWEIPDHLIEACAETPCISPHFHVPLQSGDDGVLKAMRRPYNAAHYADRLWSLKRAFPAAGIGADVIAGFPTETEDAFRRTYALIEELPVTYLHVFPYSPRRNTRAAGLEGGLSPEAKKERVALLRELGLRKRRAFCEQHLGKEVEVLIEHSQPKKTGLLQGLTGNYIKVLTPGPDAWMRELIRVRVEKVEPEHVRGTPLRLPVTS
ncbi:MAG: tRNA (N(6)-L-threonylcarbamoyladenosine(37)-C(2))-methylthiotransferase MtaB [Nitrospinota bacterium]